MIIYCFKFRVDDIYVSLARPVCTYELTLSHRIVPGLIPSVLGTVTGAIMVIDLIMTFSQ